MVKIWASAIIIVLSCPPSYAGDLLCADLFKLSATTSGKTKYVQVEPPPPEVLPYKTRLEEVIYRQATVRWMKRGLAQVADMYQGVVQSRIEFGVRLIESQAELNTLKPGTIAILSAKNSGPSVTEEVYLNSLAGSFPGWTFVNYDFDQNFYSDNTLISQIVVYGASVVRFPMGPGAQWSVDRLLEAIELSKKSGDDQVWEVRTHETGSWQKAEADMNRQMLKNFVIE